MKITDGRMLVGLILVLGLIALLFAIALGKVTQEESYGLDKGLTVLAMLASGFAGWAYGKYDKEDGK